MLSANGSRWRQFFHCWYTRIVFKPVALAYDSRPFGQRKALARYQIKKTKKFPLEHAKNEVANKLMENYRSYKIEFLLKTLRLLLVNAGDLIVNKFVLNFFEKLSALWVLHNRHVRFLDLNLGQSWASTEGFHVRDFRRQWLLFNRHFDTFRGLSRSRRRT